MVDIQNGLLASESIGNSRYLSKDFSFRFLSSCIILALATQGFGSLDLGFIYTDVTTYFIYISFFYQLINGILKFPKFLIAVYLYIVLQTFIFNFRHISFTNSYIFHFIGFVLFSLTIFSYVSHFRNKIVSIIQKYYRFVFVITCIVFIQTILFVVLRISFKPQLIFHPNSFFPFPVEILGFLPRAIGLYSEPAHYSVIILPGVYLGLLVISGKGSELGIRDKGKPLIIFVAFILSFSVVGFFGLLMCLLAVFGSVLKGRFWAKIGLAVVFAGLCVVIYSSTLMNKLRSVPEMLSGAQSFEFTSNDLSGFALVSNIYVAGNALQQSNYVGTGFNTHRDSYDKFIFQIFDASQVVMEGLNREGAGSLFIRIVSEFGVPGILIFSFFLYKCWIKENRSSPAIRYINNLSIIMLISYAARDGEYLNTFLFLFLAMAYYTHVMWTRLNKPIKPINGKQ